MRKSKGSECRSSDYEGKVKKLSGQRREWAEGEREGYCRWEKNRDRVEMMLEKDWDDLDS